MLNHGVKTSNAFSSLEDIYDLIEYLNASSRLNSSPYLYQYTSISALVNMIKTKTMHFGNAKDMNDQLEYSNGDPEIWKDLFFTCFMSEEDESIGMWSMYAQPWHEGVKLSFPKEIIRAWIKDTKKLLKYHAEPKSLPGKN